MAGDVRRRQLLGGLTGWVALLAGCSSTPSSNEDGTPSSNESPFREVRVDGLTLVVKLVGAADVNSVNVVAPDGTSFAQRPVPEGVTTVEVEIGTDYEPGEFQVLAVYDDETVGETNLDISPEIEILEVGIGANNLDQMPEGLGSTKGSEAIVEIRNSGSGPDAIERLAFNGDVPNPTPAGAGKDNASGIFDTEHGKGDVEEVLLKSNETTSVFSSTLPFSFEGEGVDCSSEPTTGTAEVSLISAVSGTTEEKYEIRYSGSDTYNGCSMSLSPEGS